MASTCEATTRVLRAARTGTALQVLALLEHQILGQVIKIVSGPGGITSVRRPSDP